MKTEQAYRSALIMMALVSACAMCSTADSQYKFDENDAKTYVVTVPVGETNEIAQAAVDLLNGNSVTNFVKRGEGVLVVKDVLGAYLGSVTIEDGIYRTNPQARPNTACGSLSGGPITVVEGASLELLTSVQNTYFSGKTIYFGGDGYRGQGALRINGKTSTDQQSVTWGQKLVMTADARIQNDMYYYARCISTTSLDMNGHKLTLANPGNVNKSWLVETWRKDTNPILNPGNVIVEAGGLNVSGYWDALWGNAYEVVIEKNAELVFNGTAAQPSRTLRLREGGRLNASGFPSGGSAWNNNWSGPVICEDPSNNKVNSNSSSYQFYIDGKVSGSGFRILKPCTFHVRGGRYATNKNAFTNGVVATDGVTVNFAYQYSLSKDCGPVVLTNATCGFTGCGDKEDARKNVLEVCNLVAHGNSTVKEGYGTWRESVTKTGAGTLAYESWMGAPLLDVQGGVVAMPSTQYAGPIADVPELPKFDNIALANGGQVDFRDHAYAVAGLSGSGSLTNVTTLTVTDSFTADAVRAAAGDCISVDGAVAFSDVTPTISTVEGFKPRNVGKTFPVLRADGGITGLKGLGVYDSTDRWCYSLSDDAKTLYVNYRPDGLMVLLK